uniref:Uncharacterized protein n=1 Tax=Panagrolaimus superbus TaxID=310955 RepID=A0A914XXU5_9BILA
MFGRIFAIFILVIVALAAAAPQVGLGVQGQTPLGGVGTNAGVGQGGQLGNAGLGSNVGGVPATGNLGVGR